MNQTNQIDTERNKFTMTNLKFPVKPTHDQMGPFYTTTHPIQIIHIKGPMSDEPDQF